MLVRLSGQDGYRREPEVPAYWLVVRRSFSVHLCRSTRLPFEPFRPHFCSHELLCPMANCSYGLARLSSSRCRRPLDCGAPGSTSSSVVSSGCILVSTSSKTGQPGIAPFGVISLSLRLRLITLTSTLIIPDITKTSSNNCLMSKTIALWKSCQWWVLVFVSGT